MTNDDELLDFDENGLTLPPGYAEGRVKNAGASIWYADYEGASRPVILLHGGTGNSGNFGKQVPAMRAAGYRVVAIDSRGQGRSTRDGKPFNYRLMASDVRAVMDRLDIGNAAIVGWSDGADTGLVLAHDEPERVAGLLFFACNVDSTGTKPFEYTETIGRCLSRHKKDYAALSSTPDQFDALFEAVGEMQRSQPNYTAADLAAVNVPVLSLLTDKDEFITLEHAEYIGRTIPQGGFRVLPEGSHFAPIQRPDAFNRMVLDFLAGLPVGT
jgi:pimeloyl-ACP methyl ester carboxylesterase